MKRFAALFLSALLFGCVLLSGCDKKDGLDHLFRYDIDAPVKNLDPQTVEESDTSSLLAIENLYEGLLRVNEDGKLTEGVAKDYTVSEDGLTYTFSLRKDAVWTDSLSVRGKSDFEASVTAYDFVFAFQRLFSPQTRSSSASTFFCIRNARAVTEGELSVDAVGVQAKDDYTLVITLDYPNVMLPSLLATAPAMPCNEEYFYDTKGRYGLDVDATPSNGPFYLRTWSYDPYGSSNYLIFRRNSDYEGSRSVYASGINFFIEKNNAGFLNSFLDNRTDCIAVRGDEAEKLVDMGYEAEKYESTTWGILFNRNVEPFADAGIRQALASSAGRASFTTALSGSFTAAKGIVPPEVSLLDKSFREYAGNASVPTLTAEEAAALFTQGREGLESKAKLDELRILLPDTSDHAEAFAYIHQQWQSELGFFCTAQSLPTAQYWAKLSSGDYDFALVPLSGGYNSPGAILSMFRGTVNMYRNGFTDEAYDALIAEAERASSLSRSADTYAQAERLLLEQVVFVPLYHEAEYLVLGNGVSGLQYNPFTKAIAFAEGMFME